MTFAASSVAGSGSSEAYLTPILQRFYRGDSSRTCSNRSGSGLGVANVQLIAVNHDGRTEARYHPICAACMDLLLPREPLP